MTERHCSACKTAKPVTAFPMKRGLPMNRCITCTQELAAQRVADKEARAKGLRECRRCRKTKSIVEFGARKGYGRAPGALLAWCKPCVVDSSMDNYHATKEAKAKRTDEKIAKLVASGTDRECSKCKRRLPLSSFARDTMTIDGLRRRCYDCVLSRRRERVAADPSLKEAGATYQRNHNLRKYGIDIDIFDAILDSQDGKCRACRTSLVDLAGHNDIHTDHNHTTGMVRGVLCRACNVILGLAEDKPDQLQALVAYLNFFVEVKTPPPGSSLETWNAHLNATKHLP